MQTEKLIERQRNLIKYRFSSNELSPKKQIPVQTPIFITSTSFSHKKTKSLYNHETIYPSNQRNILFNIYQNQKQNQKNKEKLNLSHSQDKLFFPKKNSKVFRPSISFRKNSILSRNVARPSISDVLNVLNSGNDLKSPGLQEFLDPKFNINKFSVRKIDGKEIELTSGLQLGKRRTVLKITPITLDDSDSKKTSSTSLLPIINDQIENSSIIPKKSNKSHFKPKEINIQNNETKKLIEMKQTSISSYINLPLTMDAESKELPKYIKRMSDSLIESTPISSFKHPHLASLFFHNDNQIIQNLIPSAMDGVLSFDELNFIQQQFNNHYRNNSILEKIVKKLRFFKSFNQETRVALLSISNIVFYKQNDIIFNEGETGDSIYVILKGSAIIYMKYKPKNQLIPINVIVTSVYDGDHFGDQAMLGTLLPANCRKLQNILEKEVIKSKQINNNFFNHSNSNISSPKSINSPKRKKIDHRPTLRESLIVQQSIFKSTQSKRSSTVIASEDIVLLNMPKTKWEAILMNLEQSDLEKKIEILLNVNLFETENSLSLLPLAKLAQFKNYKYGELIIDIGDELNFFYIVAFGKCSLSIGEFNEKIQVFEEGDYFAERSILNQNDWDKKKKKFKNEVECYLPKYSKLCVYAEEKETVLLNIEKNDFDTIPAKIKDKIKGFLIDLPEFDQYDVAELRERIENWKKFSKISVENVKKYKKCK